MKASTAVLAFLILCSLLGIVAARESSRALFIHLQKAQTERFHLENQWGQLQLEQATLGSNARVGQIARDRLGLEVPRNSQIVMVREP